MPTSSSCVTTAGPSRPGRLLAMVAATAALLGGCATLPGSQVPDFSTAGRPSTEAQPFDTAMTDIKVELSLCDREPIHVPGSIQPHGMMLVADLDGLLVRHVAGDIEGRLAACRSEVVSYFACLG